MVLLGTVAGVVKGTTLNDRCPNTLHEKSADIGVVMPPGRDFDKDVDENSDKEEPTAS